MATITADDADFAPEPHASHTAKANISDDPGDDEPQIPLCACCLKEISEFDQTCPHCAGPVGNHSASTEPYCQVFIPNITYGPSYTGRSRIVALLGIWALFGTQLPFVALRIVQSIQAFGDPQNPAPMAVFELLSLAFLSAWGAITLVILWRVTRWFFTKPAPISAPD